jgi:hypothetical protein
MFGREMNEFAISSQTPADYEAQVLKRNMQIKDLIKIQDHLLLQIFKNNKNISFLLKIKLII